MRSLRSLCHYTQQNEYQKENFFGVGSFLRVVSKLEFKKIANELYQKYRYQHTLDAYEEYEKNRGDNRNFFIVYSKV